MSTQDAVVAYAAEAHRQIWSDGRDVSKQTKKSQHVCEVWQDAVLDAYGERFQAEVPLNESGPAQRIDLVDRQTGTAYELKVSPNNVHMGIYRDVFKALVFNQRNLRTPIKTLVFIAPKAGMVKLGATFPGDVQKIAKGLKLELILEGI
jgi:hypothetical protein